MTAYSNNKADVRRQFHRELNLLGEGFTNTSIRTSISTSISKHKHALKEYIRELDDQGLLDDVAPDEELLPQEYSENSEEEDTYGGDSKGPMCESRNDEAGHQQRTPRAFAAEAETGKGPGSRFRRWSTDQQTLVLWANLKFTTWEKLVMFQCSFMSLKYLEQDFEGIRIREFGPELFFEERREFVGEILDCCDHAHPLLILQDEGSKEYRLEARCSKLVPAWTAFITNNLRSLGQFCRRKNEDTVELRYIKSCIFTEQCPGRHRREGLVTCELRFSSFACK